MDNNTGLQLIMSVIVLLQDIQLYNIFGFALRCMYVQAVWSAKSGTSHIELTMGEAWL